MSVDTNAEIRVLRTALRDLVALSAIPAALAGREPAAVAAGLADVLIELLQLDFVFVRLCVPSAADAVDVMRGTARKTFPAWLDNHLAQSGRFSGVEIIPDVDGGPGPGRGVAIPIGVNAEGGVVIAACGRIGFPTEIDQLLLGLAANSAATAFQDATLIRERTKAEEELRRARDVLETMVAERTAELRRSEAYLSEAQRLTHTGSAALDGVTGEVIHSSDEHSRLYGFDPEQEVPSFEEFRQRVHPEDRAGWTEALKGGIRQAVSVEGEFRVVPPGGPLKYLHAIAHPVFAASGELEELMATVVDVTERRHAAREERAQLWFLESMEAIDRAIQGTSDLEQMMGDVLDAVLEIFRCDRAWLLYPCDPEADSLRLPAERTRPEYIGALGAGADIPNGPEIAGISRSLLASDGPVRFDPESDGALPSELAERFDIKSIIAMAVYPKVDKPYAFGLHQCSRPRVWTPHEERLFHEIGRRLADGLDTLLMFRNLRESQRKLEASRVELAASRARIVAAADETRRRIERDLHDGVQQRLVSLALAQRQATATVPPELGALQAQLSGVADGLVGVLEELQEISRGIHPAALAQGGLLPALKTLARRSAVPVELEVRVQTRLPEPVERAAYYIVSEALTNTAKHAHASAVHVAVEARDGVLGLSIRDDGCGGADPTRGSGLIGLTDRVDALAGTIQVASPVGVGTTLLITLPLEESQLRRTAMTDAQAGTRSAQTTHAARPLLILAADDRNSLERDLYGLTAAPTPEQAARISADKMLIYQALLDAASQLPASVQPGILIDEQYGAAIAELAARTDGAISLAMPVEASGGPWFRYAYDDWQAHAGFFATDHAKILIRDNPGLEPGQRAAQAERLAKVSDWAAANDRALIVELLVPASPADLTALGGAAASYDATLRPEHTVQVIEYLQDHGVTPALWEVEGLDRPDDAAAIAAAAKRGGRTADCIVLGRHANHDHHLDHWLQVAAPVPGFTGFAIGRSIWWDPLHDHLHHRSTAGGTRRRIASIYSDFVRYFLDARDGTLAVQDVPETL